MDLKTADINISNLTKKRLKLWVWKRKAERREKLGTFTLEPAGAGPTQSCSPGCTFSSWQPKQKGALRPLSALCHDDN